MGDYTEAQLADFKEMFGLFDMTGAGTVPYASVGNMIRAFGQDPTNAEVEKALGSPSKEDMASKTVTFEQYMPIFDQVKKDAKPAALEDFIEGLRIFDKESNGTVLGAELRHVLLSIGEKMDQKDVDALMVGQETGDECVVDYAKFSAYLLEG